MDDKDKLIETLRERIVALEEQNARLEGENVRYREYRVKGQKTYYENNKERIKARQKAYYQRTKAASNGDAVE